MNQTNETNKTQKRFKRIEIENYIYMGKYRGFIVTMATIKDLITARSSNLTSSPIVLASIIKPINTKSKHPLDPFLKHKSTHQSNSSIQTHKNKKIYILISFIYRKITGALMSYYIPRNYNPPMHSV